MTHGLPGQDGPGATLEARGREVADLYELLEISPRASQDVIQAAYRALVRKYHPDLNATDEAEQRMRTLNAAYAVLGDRHCRARYDFECALARRYERVMHPDGASVVSPQRESRYAHNMAPPRGAAIGRPVVNRLPILNGQAVLGLLLVAGLTLILIALIVALTFDPENEYRSGYGAPMIELTRQ